MRTLLIRDLTRQQFERKVKANGWRLGHRCVFVGSVCVSFRKDYRSTLAACWREAGR